MRVTRRQGVSSILFRYRGALSGLSGTAQIRSLPFDEQMAGFNLIAALFEVPEC